jgi:hypothetical protein
MVRGGSSHSAVATPPARPGHALNPGRSESAPVLDFEPKQINAGVRVFEWSTAGVVAHECGVDAEGVTDPRALRLESRE